MIFRGIKEDNGWVIADYDATWHYGYDFMLEAAQVIIDTDFGKNPDQVAVSMIAGARDEIITDEVKKHGGILRDCPQAAEEHGTLGVAGISKSMECPIKIVFFNQTCVVRLFCPFKKLFEEHGERVFDRYMDSVELRAHIALTERQVTRRFTENKTP